MLRRTDGGGDLQRSSHWQPLVSGGEPVAHQLPGGAGNLSRSEMLCQGQKRRFSAIEVAQYLSRLLHEQARWDSLPETKRHRQRPMAMVHEQGITLSSKNRPGVLNTVADEESRVMKDRLDWMLHPQAFLQIQQCWAPWW